MRKSDAIERFKSEAKVAAALSLSRAAVNKWGEVIPLESARALEILTAGTEKELHVDEALYPALERAGRVAAEHAAP